MSRWDRVQFKSAGSSSASPAMVEQFESLANVRLPDDYRSFLLEVNGGKPVASKEQTGRYAVVAVEWNGREPQESDDTAIIRYLYKLEDWAGLFEDDRSEALTLPWAYRTYVLENRSVPVGFVPIGHDPGGSLFLLDVSGQPGSVLFWASDWFDQERMASDPYHNIGSIAPTFSSFLDAIKFED